MKSPAYIRLVATLLAAFGAAERVAAQSLPPYVETTSLTFIWNFNNTKISTVKQAISDIGVGQIDPELLDGVEPISTDTGVFSPYVPTGNQDFFIQRIVQAMTRNKGYDYNGDGYIEDVDYNDDGIILNTDIDGNGSIENVDRDGDGVISNFDYNHDGILENADQDGDGEVKNVDYDKNGVIANVDRNGDGLYTNTLALNDLNGDGVVKNVDLNGDGIFKNVDTDKNGVIDPAEIELEVEIEGEIEVEGEIEQEVTQPALLGKRAVGYNWQLLAVREVPKTVAEMATNPYTIYLSLIDRIVLATDTITPLPVSPYSLEDPPDFFLFKSPGFPEGGIAKPYPDITSTVPASFRLINTGMTLTLGQWAATGVTSETYNADNIVTAATGKVTTAFTLDFGAVFYDDPRYPLANNPVPAFTAYHLKRNVWQMSAAGHITYNIRSILGPVGSSTHSSDLPLDGSFVATNVNMTGAGQFTHDFEELDNKFGYKDNFFYHYGVAPVKVKMGNIQYQNRNLFPNFPVTTPAP